MWGPHIILSRDVSRYSIYRLDRFIKIDTDRIESSTVFRYFVPILQMLFVNIKRWYCCDWSEKTWKSSIKSYHSPVFANFIGPLVKTDRFSPGPMSLPASSDRLSNDYFLGILKHTYLDDFGLVFSIEFHKQMCFSVVFCNIHGGRHDTLVTCTTWRPLPLVHIAHVQC